MQKNPFKWQYWAVQISTLAFGRVGYVMVIRKQNCWNVTIFAIFKFKAILTEGKNSNKADDKYHKKTEMAAYAEIAQANTHYLCGFNIPPKFVRMMRHLKLNANISDRPILEILAYS